MSALRRGIRVLHALALVVALPASCVLGSFEADLQNPGEGGDGSGASASTESNVGGSFAGVGGQGGLAASGGSGPSSGSGSGECVGDDASQCPEAKTQCAKATCVMGKCSFTYTPGAATVQQPNDCKIILCDGVSDAESKTLYPADVPLDEGNPCTVEQCRSNGSPAHTPTPGAACGVSGTCSAYGSCVPLTCVTPSECLPTECVAADCTTSKCGYTPMPAGTSCNQGQDQCDATGQCVDCVNDNGCTVPLKCANNLCQ